MFVYAVLRAAQYPFGYDESFSFNYFASRSLATILTNDAPAPSNNHLLNTLAMYVTARVFGPSELSLRLFALATHALFLWGSWRIVERLTPRIAAPFAYAIFVANPWLLDYFAAARGYAPAVAFGTWSVYFVLRLLETPVRRRHAWLLGLCSSAAVLANYTFLLLAAALPVGLFLALLALSCSEPAAGGELRGRLRHTFVPIGIVYGVLAAGLAPVLLGLRARGEFYFGGTDGFWPDTIGWLGVMTGYGHLDGALEPTVAVAVAVLVAAAWSCSVRWALGGEQRKRAAFSLAVLSATVLCGLVSKLMHEWLGTSYLFQRTAMLFLLAFYVIFVDLLGTLPLRIGRGVGVLVLALSGTAMTAHLVRCANLERTFYGSWGDPYASTRDMLEYIGTERERTGAGRVRIAVEWHFQQACMYYRDTRWPWLVVESFRDMRLTDEYDYHYYRRGQAPRGTAGVPVVEVQRYPLSDTILFRVGRSCAQRMSWRRLGPGTRVPGAPARGVTQALAYDSVRDALVLHRESADPAAPAETLELRGGSWRRVAQGAGGAPGAALAYDPARRRTVRFGPAGTDAWDGTSWTHLDATPGPAARTGHAMAWDGVRQAVVLFGGRRADGTPLSDTWSWDGACWAEVACDESPGARYGHAMTSDDLTGRVLLFGGTADRTSCDDLWHWDGTRWSPVPVAGMRPPARSHPAFAFDVARGRAVLCGGLDGERLDDTWVWADRRWRRLESDVRPAGGAAKAVYCSASGTVLLVPEIASGGAETWSLAPDDLLASDQVLSLDDGGSVRYTIAAGADYSGLPYLLLGSLTGTRPGVALERGRLLLNADSYTFASIAAPDTLVRGASGLLDAAGGATAVLTIPPEASELLRGKRLFHAYAVLRGDPARPVYLSNPVPLSLR